MNIWSLSKHKNIKLLLFKVDKCLGKENICIEMLEPDDYMSIGFIKPNQVEIKAYVYTYGQIKDHYGIHLEYPWSVESEYNDTIMVYEDLNLEQIINTLAIHFEVSRFDMAV